MKNASFVTVAQTVWSFELEWQNVVE